MTSIGSGGEVTGDQVPGDEVPVVPPVDGDGGDDGRPARSGGRSGPGGVALFVERFALLVAFIGVLVFFSLWDKTSGAFGTSDNFESVARGHQAYIVILSMALLVPLLCGEFDLSVGAIAGFCQIAAAVSMTKHGFTFGESIAVAVVFGAVLGFINGNTVARIGVNSMIVTLGTSGVLLGVVNWYTKGTSISEGIPDSVNELGQLNGPLGIPRTVYVAIGVVLLVWYLFNYTPYGRYLTAIGSNQRAAQLVGLPVQWIKLSAFVASGALAGLAGILLLANAGAASPGSGSIIDTLGALAAVFLGATAIHPGRFNVEGTVIAIYFLAATVTGLELAGVQPYINDVFNGAALFIAVIVSTELRNRRTGQIGA